MTESQRAPNPWPIVVGSTIALIVGNGPVVTFTFGVFLKPVSQEFGWQRSAITAASAMATLMFAVAAPFVGMLMDRWGVRRVLLPVIALSSLSFAAISLTRAALWAFIALYTITGLAFAGQGPAPYVKAIAEWFDRTRGLALGIAMAGVGLGIMLLPPLTRLLIDAYGWRHAYVALGAIVFAVAFTAVAALVREPATSHAAQAANAGTTLAAQAANAGTALAAQAASTGTALAARAANAGTALAAHAANAGTALIASRRFWLLAAPIFLAAMAVNGTNVHVVPLLTDRGMSPAAAASIFGTVGLASIVGRLACGYLADRLPAPRVAAGFFLLPCIGIYLLMTQTSRLPVLLGVISLGLALGCEVDMMGLLTTRYFGVRRFAERYGYLFGVFAAGSALGPYLMGLSFDRLHSYNPILTVFIVALVIASALISRSPE